MKKSEIFDIILEKICESGIDRKGEEFQYLSGEIFRQSYPVAKMFICGGCRRGRR